jgi:DNA-binding Lrp family transcriptional regulator
VYNDLSPVEEDAMAAKAFVLIETAVGKTKEVINILKKREGIKSVDAVTGPYDIIAVVEGDDLNAIGSMVTNKVHPIPGINRTVTCLAIKVN